MQNMSEPVKSKYTFEKRENYLYMTITGKYELSDFKKYLELMRSRCEKEETNKILIFLSIFNREIWASIKKNSHF